MPLDFPRLFFAPINKLLSTKKHVFSVNSKNSPQDEGYNKLLDDGLVTHKPIEKMFLSMPIVPFNSPVVTPSSSFLSFVCSGRSFSLHTHVQESFPLATLELPRSESFNISLDSETSEEDHDSKAMAAFEVKLLQPYNWEKDADGRSVMGLGITGLTRKDGTAAFDGLGIVAIKSTSSSPTEQTFNGDQLILPATENPFDHPSDTLINEALVTFMASCDREQLLQTISECPWLEEEDLLALGSDCSSV